MIDSVFVLRRLDTAQNYNITDKVIKDDTIQVSEALEYKAFQRRHGNVRLKVSNMDRFFSDLFLSGLGTTRWELTIYIFGVERWIGEVHNKSIVFTVDDEYAFFDCWSKTKLIWDHLANLQIIKPIRFPESIEINGYLTLNYFLGWFMQELSKGGTLFHGIDYGIYANRKIRGMFDNPVGNEGRFRELALDNWKKLFEAMQIYYNCEFVFDLQSRYLLMKQRFFVDTTTTKRIDTIRKDKSTSINLYDDDKVDYLYTYGEVSGAIPAPSFVSMERVAGEGIPSFSYQKYRMTAVVNGQETFLSSEVRVDLNLAGNAWEITMGMPATAFAAVQQRNLYRYNSFRPEAGWRLVGFVFGNSYETIQDRMGSERHAQQQQLGTIRTLVNAWVRYDELSRTWTTPILDLNNAAPPQGEVLDIRPRLRFHEIANPTSFIEENPYYAFCFFGRELNVTDSVWRNQWLDLFTTRRKVRVTVKDIEYKLGQNIDLALDSMPSRYSVRSFSSKITKEETELELLSVY